MPVDHRDFQRKDCGYTDSNMVPRLNSNMNSLKPPGRKPNVKSQLSSTCQTNQRRPGRSFDPQFLQVWPTNPCVWNALRPLLTIWGLDFLPLNLLSRGSGGQAPSCLPGSTGTARTAEPTTPVRGTAFPREPSPAPQRGRKQI